MEKYFRQLDEQRKEFYEDIQLNFDNPWQRPLPDKWSIGETLYHLLLMAKLFRRFSAFYIPPAKPIAHLRKNKPYKTEIHDIYSEYTSTKKKPMKAPSLIKPPDNLEKKWTIDEIRLALDEETKRLKHLVESIDEPIAGHIVFPDPVAYYPNLIQTIHILAIHEAHHFRLTKNYYIHNKRLPSN